METLSTQFEQALERIEISGKKRERAIEAHKELRGVLEGSEELQELGIDTVLTGSYARHTGIYTGHAVPPLGLASVGRFRAATTTFGATPQDGHLLGHTLVLLALQSAALA